MDMKSRRRGGNSEVSWERLRDLPLEKFSDLKVLVLGDFMLDEYIWGRVERISPEAPVAVVDVERETRTLGGAGNVANNLVALGARVEVCALVGEDNPAGLLREELGRLGIDPQGLFPDPQRRTTRKTRVFANQQQVVRIDRETRVPGSPAFLDWALSRLDALLPSLNALILSDYGKGTLFPRLLQEAIRRARDRNLPVVVDPKGHDYYPYAGATAITPNHKEMELVTGLPLTSWEELVKQGRELRERLSLEALLITQGAEGMTLILREEALRIPAADPPGGLRCFRRRGHGGGGPGPGPGPMGGPGPGRGPGEFGCGGGDYQKRDRAYTAFGNGAGTPGPRAPGGKNRHPQGTGLPRPHLRAQGKKVVFTNGCFDLLHGGHIKFLEDSRRLGDTLVVALDSDRSVARVKGEGRPVIGEDQRQRILAALEVVDYVTLFDSEQLSEILQNLQPDILTKGSNYPEKEVAGREIVQAYGGRVQILPVTEPVSVSELINRIRGEE